MTDYGTKPRVGAVHITKRSGTAGARSDQLSEIKKISLGARRFLDHLLIRSFAASQLATKSDFPFLASWIAGVFSHKAHYGADRATYTGGEVRNSKTTENNAGRRSVQSGPIVLPIRRAGGRGGLERYFRAPQTSCPGRP